MKRNSVIILKMSALGDIMHALPLANTLKKNISGLRLGWIVEKNYADILEPHGCIDELFVFERGGGARNSLRSFFDIIRKIKSRGYDTIIDLQGSAKGSLWVLFSGLGSVGFKRGSSRVESFSTLFTGLKVAEAGAHIVERNLAFAGVFGIEEYDYSPGELVTGEAASGVRRFLRRSGLAGKKIAAVHPGTTWKTKMWEPGNYIRLIDRIHSGIEGAGVVVTAGCGEEPMARNIINACKKPPVLFEGASLRELAALLAGCSVFIGADSGPLHMASAVGTGVVGLYGPTDPKRNGPFWAGGVALTSGVACAACWKKKCRRADCMTGIGVEEVFENAVRIINAAATGSAGDAG